LPREGNDSAIDEEFIDGTAPTEMAPLPDAGVARTPKPEGARKRGPDAGTPEEPPPF
jgi:hypothetical protein